MPGRPGLDVVIVSYRCRDLLRDCLESVRAHLPAASTALHLVDNDSRDGTSELVREDFPEVDLVASAENLGFARASNIGIRRGTHEYVLLLNPDTLVHEGTIDRLLELMAERPHIGIAGCRLEREDGTLDHAARRSFPTIVGALGHFTSLGRRPGASGALAQYTAPEVKVGPVDAVNGAFMLIRRAALDEVGLLDEGYWMYMEDLDLCYRFAQAGWVTWYEPSVTATHLKHGTSGELRGPRLNVAFHYGMFRFYRKHYARRRNPLVNVAVYGGIAVKLLMSLVRTELRRRRRSVAA
jgi:N-acetylglucosaminyl-diphospho-decaprenol L-rhamnosyltransferase